MSIRLIRCLVRGEISLSKLSLLPLLFLMAVPATGADYFYTVKPGDHPWNLAQRFLTRPEMGLQLRAINKIPDDRRILPGVKLRIPMAWLKLTPVQVKVLAVSGSATAVAGGTASALVQGMLLTPPLTLVTGDLGSVSLLFADGSRVLMRARSEVQVKQAHQQAMNQINLVELVLSKGSLESQIIPMGDSGGRFEIRTPAAVAAVRGTEFRVTAEDGQARTEVLSGRVSVANPVGEVLAQDGQGSVARGSGLPPDDPVRLLAAPNLSGLSNRVERLPLDLPFEPLAGATGYRTQIAPTAAFDSLLSDEIGTVPRVRARDLDDGNYVIRVRGVDPQGLEGWSAQHSFTLRARPEPPLLMEPMPEALFESGWPTFRWTLADPSWNYRLQVMAGDSLTPVVDQTIRSGQQPLAAQDLAPGHYRWRVAAIQPGKGQGPWGDMQGFRRVLPGPGVEAPQSVDGLLVLRWANQESGETYHLQVSKTSDFLNPLVDVRVDQPQHSLRDLGPGAYQVRVRAIGTDGFSGLWGDNQTFEVTEPEPPRWPWLLLLLPLLG